MQEDNSGVDPQICRGREFKWGASPNSFGNRWQRQAAAPNPQKLDNNAAVRTMKRERWFGRRPARIIAVKLVKRA